MSTGERQRLAAVQDLCRDARARLGPQDPFRLRVLIEMALVEIDRAVRQGQPGETRPVGGAARGETCAAPMRRAAQPKATRHTAPGPTSAGPTFGPKTGLTVPGS